MAAVAAAARTSRRWAAYAGAVVLKLLGMVCHTWLSLDEIGLGMLTNCDCQGGESHKSDESASSV